MFQYSVPVIMKFQGSTKILQIAITIYGNKIFSRIKICLTSACRTARFLQVNVKSSKRDCFVGDLRQTKTKTYFAKNGLSVIAPLKNLRIYYKRIDLLLMVVFLWLYFW